MLKVLHINTNYINNPLHQNMIDALNEKGIDNTVVVPTCDFKNSVITPKDYVKILECFGKYDRLYYGRKQRKILWAIKHNCDVASFDIIHAYTVFTDGGVAYRLKREFGKKYVVAVRNTDINTFFKYMVHLRRWGIEILRNASAIFFLSRAYKDELFDKYLSERDKAEIEKKSYIIPNCLDTFWITNKPSMPTDEDIRRIKEKKLSLCYAGKIDKNKNISATLTACEILSERGYDVSFNVVGKIMDKAEYDKIISHRAVTYHSAMPKEELINFYRQNDIFVMPSRTESFGMVYVEAMSQALPVIYTKGQGFDGHINDGEAGYGVNCDDSVAIADCCEKIANDYFSFAKNAYTASCAYNWSDVAAKYQKIYFHIVE